MAKKHRDYDTIIKGCEDFAKAVEAARAAAGLLSKEAGAAEATLKDRVAKKNIDAIKELSEVILKTTAAGEERVQELERKMKAEKARFEELEH
jgi:hypothetical protein